MQVCFDSRWCIKGCIIQDYLLEQSRITFQSAGERNYHVLYQLVAEGKTNRELATGLHLQEPSFYRYLKGSSNSVSIDIALEARRFEALRLAFTVLQISQSIIDGIFKVLSAILWLGNLDFEVSPTGTTNRYGWLGDTLINTHINNVLIYLFLFSSLPFPFE